MSLSFVSLIVSELREERVSVFQSTSIACCRVGFGNDSMNNTVSSVSQVACYTVEIQNLTFIGFIPLLTDVSATEKELE
jgi:hypothetical protein